jgi:proton-dependent oligopeptide transporter, POT family
MSLKGADYTRTAWLYILSFIETQVAFFNHQSNIAAYIAPKRTKHKAQHSKNTVSQAMNVAAQHQKPLTACGKAGYLCPAYVAGTAPNQDAANLITTLERVMSTAVKRDDAFVPPPAGDILGHPKQLWMLFATEFWERFCFYSLRWMLVFYVVAKFYDGSPSGESPAGGIYGAFTALIYALSIFGGLAADRILGYQRAILTGAVFIIIGFVALTGESLTSFYSGLAFIIVGNSLFKPNISSMVGQLYRQGDERRDRGFTIFYMGINAGAFVAPIITGIIAAKYGYLQVNAATLQSSGLRTVFIVAGIGMVISLIWFWFGKQSLGHVGKPPAGKESLASAVPAVIGAVFAVPLMYYMLGNGTWLNYILVGMFIICLGILIFEAMKDGPIQRDKVIALVILFIFNILFWMFFEQAGSSFSFLAEKIVDRNVMGLFEFQVAWFQSVNPAAIVILAPIVTAIWAFTSKRNFEPSIPRKFAIGLLGNAIGFLILMYALQYLVDDRNMIPFWTLTACYVFQTIGELAISPIGLSMVTKLAPARIVGATMGAWFLSISLGYKAAAELAKKMSAGDDGLTVASSLSGFTFSFYLLLGAGILLFLIAPQVNKLMHGVK